MIGAKAVVAYLKGGELRNCVNQEFLYRRQYVDRHRQHHSEWGKDREERLIGAHALIPEKKEIPDNSMVVGSPGKVIRETTPVTSSLGAGRWHGVGRRLSARRRWAAGHTGGGQRPCIGRQER